MTSTRQHPRQQGAKLSVLAAAWNEADNIDAFIRSFLALSYPRKELVLCAGGNDGTFELADRYRQPEITLLRQQPGEGKQRSLREGYRYVTGDIVLLTDADCVLNDDSVARLVQPILDNREDVTNGTSKPKRNQLDDPFVVYQYASQMVGLAPGQAPSYIKGLLGRNSAVRRAVLDSVHAFDEDVATGTDSFLAKKLIAAGHRIRFVPESVVETEYPSRFGAYSRQQSRWFRNNVVRNWQFRNYSRTSRALVPIGIATAMLFLPMVAIFAWPVTVLWLILFGYMYRTRVKALRNLQTIDGEADVRWSTYLRVPLYMLVEWITRTSVLTRLSSSRW